MSRQVERDDTKADLITQFGSSLALRSPSRSTGNRSDSPTDRRISRFPLSMHWRRRSPAPRSIPAQAAHDLAGAPAGERAITRRKRSAITVPQSLSVRSCDDRLIEYYAMRSADLGCEPWHRRASKRHVRRYSSGSVTTGGSSSWSSFSSSSSPSSSSSLGSRGGGELPRRVQLINQVATYLEIWSHVSSCPDVVTVSSISPFGLRGLWKTAVR